MDTYALVIETGYKRTSPNYRIRATEPMPREEAEALFADLRSGRSDLWPQDAEALVIDASPTQIVRVRKHLGASIMDRVTMGPVVPQG